MIKSYKPGDVATILGVSISSIRNWTDIPEFAEFLSESARRVGNHQNAHQREYTLQDVYVLNTVAKHKTRFVTWQEIAQYIRDGNLDTELPPAASLVMSTTAADSFADGLLLRERISALTKTLNEAEQEINYWRGQVDKTREEEQLKSRAREELLREEIIQLHRQLARLEVQMEMLQRKEGK
jgi:DNA-binding transcriptional MerR regulator